NFKLRGHFYVLREASFKDKHAYPNSLLRLLATAVSALPPPYLFLKSAFIRSKNAIEMCLLTASLATTQYAKI
ncbi:hypothetical protein OFM39_29205, partial [Escherichia coli]|nr:hypothetical protein [Escherichia coli]